MKTNRIFDIIITALLVVITTIGLIVPITTSAEQQFDVLGYERETEQQIKEQINKQSGEIVKGFKFTFDHKYDRTINDKSNVEFGCDCSTSTKPFFLLRRKEMLCHCTLTHHVLPDPDCWPCINPFHSKEIFK